MQVIQAIIDVIMWLGFGIGALLALLVVLVILFLIGGRDGSP